MLNEVYSFFINGITSIGLYAVNYFVIADILGTVWSVANVRKEISKFSCKILQHCVYDFYVTLTGSRRPAT